MWLEANPSVVAEEAQRSLGLHHRNVTRKLVVEGGWVQQFVYDIGFVERMEVKGCSQEEGTEKHRLYHCPSWREVRYHIQEGLENREQRSSHLMVCRWESEKYKCWRMAVEGFRDHPITDGSVLLDHDELMDAVTCSVRS